MCSDLRLFILQLFEYILEYLRTVRFGEAEHSLALPAEQTELAQIVREVSTLPPSPSSMSPTICCYACKQLLVLLSQQLLSWLGGKGRLGQALLESRGWTAAHGLDVH